MEFTEKTRCRQQLLPFRTFHYGPKGSDTYRWVDQFSADSLLDSDASDALLDLPVQGVAVLCTHLEKGGGVNATEFLQGVGWFFTFGQVHVRDWISHFALRVWAKAEHPTTGEVLYINFRIQRGAKGKKGNGGSGVECKRVPSHHKVATDDEREGRYFHHDQFPAGRVTLRDVASFLKEQEAYGYDFFGKNCKHFAYDFFRHRLGERREFPGFCQEIERSLHGA